MFTDFVYGIRRKLTKDFGERHPEPDMQPSALVRYREIVFKKYALGHATEAEIRLLPQLYFRGNDEAMRLMEKSIRRQTCYGENARMSGWICFPDDPEAAELVRLSICREIDDRQSRVLQEKWNQAHRANSVAYCCLDTHLTDDEKAQLASGFGVDVTLISEEPLPGEHSWRLDPEDQYAGPPEHPEDAEKFNRWREFDRFGTFSMWELGSSCNCAICRGGSYPYVNSDWGYERIYRRRGSYDYPRSILLMDGETTGWRDYHTPEDARRTADVIAESIRRYKAGTKFGAYWYPELSAASRDALDAGRLQANAFWDGEPLRFGGRKQSGRTRKIVLAFAALALGAATAAGALALLRRRRAGT